MTHEKECPKYVTWSTKNGKFLSLGDFCAIIHISITFIVLLRQPNDDERFILVVDDKRFLVCQNSSVVSSGSLIDNLYRFDVSRSNNEILQTTSCGTKHKLTENSATL
ncbi:hypothetical protein Lal_00022809 [Lupinus albus]|nr:hypothetical protein Lal_00022809 [Lupinus albus]